MLRYEDIKLGDLILVKTGNLYFCDGQCFDDKNLHLCDSVYVPKNAVVLVIKKSDSNSYMHGILALYNEKEVGLFDESFMHALEKSYIAILPCEKEEPTPIET